MKICLISNQIAAWGKIGGFGTATRGLGRGLVKSGAEVSAVVLRRPGYGQKPIEKLDGITVYGLSSSEILTSGRIFKKIDADIYHSQEPTVSSYFAQRIMPQRVHVVTCRDPRSWRDHLVEFVHTNYKRRLLAPVTFYYEASPLVKKAVRQADMVLSPAPTVLHPRIKELYGDKVEPEFMPYPVDVPERKPRKSESPLILFVGRFDHRKRIERFFQLAKDFPSLQFVAIGKAHDESYDKQLRQDFGKISNLHMPGFISRFAVPNISTYYEKAWLLVNTSPREGLPYTFLEASAFGVAILSGIDPEGFASRFGYFAKDSNYGAGIQYLLDNNRWFEKGCLGAEFVRKTWGEKSSIDKHLQLYERLVAEKT